MIIFDLEATCGDDMNNNEIIEIGAVYLDINFNQPNLMSTFRMFVKPTENSILTDFCTKLTTIKQEDLPENTIFKDAMDWLWDWAKAWHDEDFFFLSWGYYDRKQIVKEAERKNIQHPLVDYIKKHHESIKHRFAHVHKCKPCGMMAAMGFDFINIPYEGTHHRALDDTINIVKIVKADELLKADLVKRMKSGR